MKPQELFDKNGTLQITGCAPMDCIYILDPKLVNGSELFRFSLQKLDLADSMDYLKIFLHLYHKFGLIKTYR